MRIWSLGLAAIIAMAAVACDKDKEPESVPTETDEPDDDKAGDKADDADDDKADDKADDKGDDAEATASATASASAVAPTSTTPPAVKPTTKVANHGDISACCSALSSEAKGLKANKMRGAAGICSSLNTMVKTGKTSRAAALAQIRAFVGHDAPGACR